MPSDANGVYSLPSGYEAVTGETIQASQHNPPLEDLASAMSQRLMRSGVAPMTGPLKITDGSVGSPAIKFSTDSTTGFYKTTNGIGVSVGGAKVAEFTPDGIKKDARWIGELIPFTGLSPPALTVLPYGQTISRTTYADLWAFAQTEIAAGNTFYNNGNGTTTFGIGDLRGRVIAGKDNMGGPNANRLGGVLIGGDPLILGSAGGLSQKTLNYLEIPANIPNSASSTFSFSTNLAGVTLQRNTTSTVSGSTGSPVPQTTNIVASFSGSVSTSVTVNPNGGTAFSLVQPTMICNYILFAGA